MGAAEIIAIISALISGITAVVAGVAIKSSRVEKEYELSYQTYKEIRDWYEKTLSIMKQLYTRFPSNEHVDEKNMLLSDLSCEIDFGRSHFPNKEDGTNENKPNAFKGSRPILFDILTTYYDIFAKGEQADNLDVLRALQRAFSSELTIYLKNNKHTKRIKPYETFDQTKNMTVDGLPLLSFTHLQDPFVRQIICEKDLVKTFTNLDTYHKVCYSLMYKEQQELRQKQHKQNYMDNMHMQNKQPSTHSIEQMQKVIEEATKKLGDPSKQIVNKEDTLTLNKDSKNKNDAQLSGVLVDINMNTEIEDIDPDNE